MFIGIIIFGVEVTDGTTGQFGWSFAMAIVGMIFTIGAGVLAILQMKASSVACFK